MRKGDIGIVRTDSGWIPKDTKVKIVYAFNVYEECLVESMDTGYTAIFKNEDIDVISHEDETGKTGDALFGGIEIVMQKCAQVLGIIDACEGVIMDEDNAIDSVVAKALAYDHIKRIMGGNKNE